MSKLECLDIFEHFSKNMIKKVQEVCICLKVIEEKAQNKEKKVTIV